MSRSNWKVAVLLVLLAGGAALAASAAPAEKWRVGAECDHFPFAFAKKGGKVVGYDVRIVRKLAKLEKAKLDVVCLGPDEIASGDGVSKYDLIVSPVSVTSERKGVLDFSDSYRMISGAAKSGGKTVGVIVTNDGEAYASSKAKLEDLRLFGIPPMEEEPKGLGVGLGVPRGSSLTIDGVNQGLATLEGHGILGKHRKKIFSVDIKADRLLCAEGTKPCMVGGVPSCC